MKELSEWAEEAQNGSEEAICWLLEKYGFRKDGVPVGYLGKYYRLLVYGKIDLRDKDTRRFLQLYIAQADVRKKLTNRFQDYPTTLCAQQTADYLSEKSRLLPAEDLQQELIGAFLDLVHRYIPKPHVSFEGYIYNTYRFKVYELLRKYIFKYEAFHHPELLYLDEFEDKRAVIEPQEAWFDRFYASELKREDLGIFWINGRCGALFKELTVFERMVIRDHDFYGYNDEAIAEKYGYHRNTILKARHRAINKIKKKREQEPN